MRLLHLALLAWSVLLFAGCVRAKSEVVVHEDDSLDDLEVASGASGSGHHNTSAGSKQNLADKVRIVRVTFDDKPDPENKASGFYIHIYWRNDTGHALREVTAKLRVTSDDGTLISGAPDYIWLYADKRPLPPGKSYMTHDLVAFPPAEGDPIPTRHNLKLDYATEALSKL